MEFPMEHKLRNSFDEGNETISRIYIPIYYGNYLPHLSIQHAATTRVLTHKCRIDILTLDKSKFVNGIMEQPGPV